MYNLTTGLLGIRAYSWGNLLVNGLASMPRQQMRMGYRDMENISGTLSHIPHLLCGDCF